MSDPAAPWHAHIYCNAHERPTARALRDRFENNSSIHYMGAIAPGPVGPHPIPQFEIHFREDALAQVRALIMTSGLTALVHPLTNDDLADHTTLAQWLGTPLPLDLSVLDPPGHNQGLARFGARDF